MLPSATVLSGSDLWVTVDAAISNDLFYFEHNPIRLDNLAITAPDGSPVKAENASTGKFRSTFDVPLAQPGTYKIAVVNDMAAAMYEDGGETKRWRGAAEALAREVPAGAKNLQVSRTHSRHGGVRHRRQAHGQGAPADRRRPRARSHHPSQ